MGGVAFSTYATDTTGIATRQGDLLALIGMLLFSAYYVVSKRTREELDSMTSIPQCLTLRKYTARCKLSRLSWLIRREPMIVSDTVL